MEPDGSHATNVEDGSTMDATRKFVASATIAVSFLLSAVNLFRPVYSLSYFL